MDKTYSVVKGFIPHRIFYFQNNMLKTSIYTAFARQNFFYKKVVSSYLIFFASF